jgi:aryl-alcohol dehydrogenase-like predicted oxidoreductase
MGLPGWTALQLRQSYLQPRPGSRLPDAGHQLLTPGDLDYANAEGDIAVWAYTPLLNGAYTRADRPLPEVYEHPGTTRRLELLDVLSREHGATRNQLVLAWLMAQTPGISPIVGVSSLAQLDEALAAQDLALSPDDVQRLNEAA